MGNMVQVNETEVKTQPEEIRPCSVTVLSYLPT